MDERALDREDPTANDDETHHLCNALVALGEGKAAVDLLRGKVKAARSSLPGTSPALLRLLSVYAEILESTDALAEAEFIRTEALEIVASTQTASQNAIDAFLKHGLLLCKMHDYDGAVTKLKEAVRRTEELDSLGALQQQIILAEAWRGQAQAFEALGEFSQASDALDALLNVKRKIRFIVFSMVS